MTKYFYFKPSGKWKYEGEGKPIPKEYWGDSITHDILKEINDGSMPGITSDGKDYFIVVLDEGSWPRLLYPETMESLQETMNWSFNKHTYLYRALMDKHKAG